MGELDLGSWLILRMASADTLKVCKALNRAGIEAWTPTERKTSRMPRNRARSEKDVAIVPSYVFGHIRHFADLMKLAMTANPDMPRFSVFHHNGGVPLIADDELAALRHEEDKRVRLFERAKRKFTRGPVFSPGTTVRTDQGGFAGLSGVVQDTQGQYTLVSFAGFHSPIKIASLLLRDDVVADAQGAVRAA